MPHFISTVSHLNNNQDRQPNKNKSKLFSRRFAVCLVIALLIIIIILMALNTKLEITRYSVQSNNLPQEFDNFKIAHISDLHANLDPALLKALSENQPNAIMFTGDIIDEYTQSYPDVLDYITQCAQIAPCFYVIGNHEYCIDDMEKVLNQIAACGVVVLDNQIARITKGDSSIYITGICDPAFSSEEAAKLKLQSDLTKVQPQDGYNIMLFHRANMLELLPKSGYDLILSGHLHGGQIRLPLIGGLIAPNGQWMPDYSSGKYALNQNTTAIVSRGLANHISVPRIFNRYQLIFITLKCE